MDSGATPVVSVSTLVIGGGVAGIAVAAELDDVMLVEASSALGGRAALSGGVMLFVDTPQQAACGMTDSVEIATAAWPSLTGGEATAATVRWLEASAGVEARLEDLGVEFTLPCGSPGDVGRNHLVVGRGEALVARLVAALPGTVDTRLDTWVDGLLVDDTGVIGAQIGDTRVLADRVVIASGGFAGNAELIEESGMFAAGTWGPASSSDGNGWAATHGRAAGAALASMDRIGAYAVNVAVPPEQGYAVPPDMSLLLRSVFVDSTGASFTNGETEGSCEQSLAVREHNPVYAVLSNAALPELFSAAESLAKVDGVKVCEGSIRRLAETMGMEASELADALTPLPERDPRVFNTRMDTEFADGLCAVPVGWGVQKSFGGLAVDSDGRVLNQEGAVIPGLWAVGEAAGMGEPGMGGLVGFDGSLSAVLWSAWRSAEAIAGEGA